MRLPFFENTVRKKPDEMTAVDLGSRTTKAVHLQRQGEGFTLCGYALLDAPIFEKSLSVELLAEHLRAVAHALELKTRHVTLAVRVDDAQVRHADIPPIPIEDMRMVLKLNPKNYLQQDLPGHVFDCHVNARPHQAKSANKAKTLEGIPKQRVLVAGARQQIVNDLVQGAKAAGLAPQCITPGVIGPVNTFERAMPEVFAKLRDLVYESYYTQPSVWKLIGYELHPTNESGPNMSPFDDSVLAKVAKMRKLYREIGEG